MKLQKMFIIVFGIFIIKFQISVSDLQFPPHVDLQKVGEAIFNNEKFNILKPTTHHVTDHFKDFMLRTENSDHPARRVFIDNNGFRHDWSGFDKKTRSLRKTDLKHVSGSFENASENTPVTDIIAGNGNDNATATVKYIDSNDNNLSSNKNENNQKVDNNASDNNDTVQNLTEEDLDTPKSKETTEKNNLFPATQKNNLSTKVTIEKRLRQGKDVKAKPTRSNTAPNKQDGGQKNAPANKKDGKNMDENTDSDDKLKPPPARSNTATKKPGDGKKDAPASKNPAPANSNTATKQLGGGKKDVPTSKTDGKNDDKKTDSGDKAQKEKKKESEAKRERTVATTTFFCPYFGTITMSAFID